jgi:hypothetical protein
MAIRSVSVDGVQWTAWDVIPESAPSSNPALLKSELQRGWLCLESKTHKRRIIPAPAGWDAWSDDRLIEEIRSAPEVRSRGDILPFPRM